MERPLFGGAITCRIPADWKDISDIRQVPDNQECWQDVANDRLLVIEMFEYQADVANSNAAAFFFQDLASANGAVITEQQFTPIPSTAGPLQQMTAAINNTASIGCFGIGYQRVAMGRDVDVAGNPRHDQEVRWIRVELCVLRLTAQETDLLITLSSPSETNPQEEAQQTQGFSDVFQQVITSFQIHDWSLFG